MQEPRPRSAICSALSDPSSKKAASCKRSALDHRPEQTQMALAVARALETDHPLLFEAGTGVGKSLAYLIGILHSIHTERPFIVSSHTISVPGANKEQRPQNLRVTLQAIPALHRYSGFKTALMVGKGNYCCTTRYQRTQRCKKRPV